MKDSEYVNVAAQMWWVLKATGNMKEDDGKITFIK